MLELWADFAAIAPIVVLLVLVAMVYLIFCFGTDETETEAPPRTGFNRRWEGRL
jgi:heme/copper-type cytochrome/quinol oxidase subunit 2